MIKQKLNNLLEKLPDYSNAKKWYALGLIVIILTAGTFTYLLLKQRSDKEKISNSNSAEQQSEIIHQATYPTGDVDSEDNSQAQPSNSSASSPSNDNTGSTAPKSNNSTSSNQSSGSQTSTSSSPSNHDSEDDTDNSPPENPPVPESPSATVAFYADSQTDNNPAGEEENHQRVVNYILNTSANTVFHAGDLMEDGTQASLDSFNRVTSTLRTTRSFYAAIGNNDRNEPYTDVSPLFLNNFQFPNNERWYSANIGNLHMIVLDSAFSATSQAQLDWLQSDLQSSASTSRITGVMYHHPTGTLASSISGILRDNGVDFVIAGHIHSYSHTVSNGIQYFTLSGQQSIGYMIAKVYENNVSFTVYNSNNQVIDTITFNER